MIKRKWIYVLPVPRAEPSSAATKGCACARPHPLCRPTRVPGFKPILPMSVTRSTHIYTELELVERKPKTVSSWLTYMNRAQ